MTQDFFEQLKKSYDQVAQDYSEQTHVQKLTNKSLKRFVEFLPDGNNVLDIGCAGGYDTGVLKNLGCKVFPIDFSDQMLELAREGHPDIEFVKGEFMDFDFRGRKFEGIRCNRIFQHIKLENQNTFLEKINSLCKNEGVLYISCKLSDNIYDYESWDGDVFEEYGVDKTNVRFFRKRLTTDSFRSLIQNNGFEILEDRIWTNGDWSEIYCKKLN